MANFIFKTFTKNDSAKKHGFSFIELMIAIAIIGVLATVGAASYTSSLKSSRDSRRKTDLENMRNALELYKSDSATSQYPDDVSKLDTSTSGGVKYIAIPKDPKSGYMYGYYPAPNNCNNAGPVYCTEYLVGTVLENASSGSACKSLGAYCNNGTTKVNCNYCLDQYGPR